MTGDTHPIRFYQYSLEALLTIQPGNEAALIATAEFCQIKAFAGLAVSQASGSNILERVEPHYARAERLNAAAFAMQDKRLIRQDYAAMLRRCLTGVPLGWAGRQGGGGGGESGGILEQKN